MRWKKHYEQIAERLPFDLCLAAGDEDKFSELVGNAEHLGLSSDLRVLLGETLLGYGDVVAAIEQFRRPKQSTRTARPPEPE